MHFFSCQNQLDLDNFEETNLLVTRSVGLNAVSLENCDSCLLGSGTKTVLPWCSGASGTIPDETRKDIKESDGWKVLYSTIKILNYDRKIDQADPHANYLLLYNRLTGVLKGFVYLESITGNNQAYWKLDIPQKTKLFNFSGEFALPYNSSSSPQTLILSNISTNGITQGFDRGWNCFMTELSYDENSMNETLDISAYVMNVSSIKQAGSINAQSKGTIVTASGGNFASQLISGISKAVGNGAEAWMKDDDGGKKHIKASGLNTMLGNIANFNAGSLVQYGLTQIFSSFLGSTSSSLDLQFSTTGSVNITGTMSTPSSGYVCPIQGIPLNGTGESLGIWNLTEEPKCQESSCGKLYTARYGSGYNEFYYEFKITPSYKVITNPAIKASISTNLSMVNYDPKLYLEKYQFPNNRTYQNKQCFFIKNTKEALYSDSICTISNQANKFLILIPNALPNCTSTDNIPSFAFDNSQYYTFNNIAFRVLASFNIDGKDIYSSKTFIPKHLYISNGSRPYQWTQKEIEAKNYFNYKDIYKFQ